MSKNESKPGSKNITRTEVLIAVFKDGYASGWEFAVKEAFRDALISVLQQGPLTKLAGRYTPKAITFPLKREIRCIIAS